MKLLQFFGGLIGLVTLPVPVFCDTCPEVRRTLTVRQYEAYKKSGFKVTACRCGGMLRHPLAEVVTA